MLLVATRICRSTAEVTESIPVKEHTRKAKSRQSDIFKGVPSRDEIIPLSDEQRHCTDCGAELEVIGKEFVRREFRFTPAKGKVVNIYVETAKCPVCSEAPAMAKAIQFVKSHAPVPSGTGLESNGGPA